MKVLGSLLAAAYSQNFTDQYDYDYEAASRSMYYPPIFATIDQLRAPPISCWTCDSAASVADCRDNGYVQQCLSNEQVCEIEVRKRNGNRVESVTTGCKWRRACLDNKRQNFLYANKSQHQCKPAPWHQFVKDEPSVCRQCCDKHTNCGIEFMEFYKKPAFKGKAPLQKKKWDENLLDMDVHVCAIDGEDSKVTVKTTTANVAGADTDKQQLFKFVSSDDSCTFDWVTLDNVPGNDFEQGATNTFEFDMAEVHINDHCFHSIVNVLWKDGNCMGATCDEWIADDVDIFVKSVDECTTRTIALSGFTSGIDTQLTLDAPQMLDNHWIVSMN